MASLWKWKREFGRIGRHLLEWPDQFDNYLFGMRRYDNSLAKEVRCFAGQLPFEPRIAIFLIFPKYGLQQSHLATLDYFRNKGYSVLAVSNLPLSEQDREILLGKCWTYLERPNFGHDFGGYRDAILHLESILGNVDRLVLINDSTWFPLPGATDWLDEVEALNVDFAGAASNYGTPRLDIEAFRTIKWDYDTNHRNFHYCSFALCLRSAVIRHPDFVIFWRRLRLSDKKKRTVRRGEIGFTRWALGRNFSHGATLDIASLDAELELLSEARLAAIARMLIIQEHPRLQQFLQSILSQPTQTQPELIKLILLAVTLQGSSYALAPYTTCERKYPFLKKSPVWLGQESCSNTLELLENIEGAAYLLAEAKELSRRHKAI